MFWPNWTCDWYGKGIFGYWIFPKIKLRNFKMREHSDLEIIAKGEREREREKKERRQHATRLYAAICVLTEVGICKGLIASLLSWLDIGIVSDGTFVHTIRPKSEGLFTIEGFQTYERSVEKDWLLASERLMPETRDIEKSWTCHNTPSCQRHSFNDIYRFRKCAPQNSYVLCNQLSSINEQPRLIEKEQTSPLSPSFTSILRCGRLPTLTWPF